MTPPGPAVASLVARPPRGRPGPLPALDAVQRAQGSVSPGALDVIAAHLRVPASEVWGVATHYPELRLTPPGRRLVRVCAGVSCRIGGGAPLLRGRGGGPAAARAPPRPPPRGAPPGGARPAAGALRGAARGGRATATRAHARGGRGLVRGGGRGARGARGGPGPGGAGA